MGNAIAISRDIRAMHQVISDHCTGRKIMIKTFARLAGVAAIVALVGVGCSSTMSHQMTPTAMAATPQSVRATAMATPAAELRSMLNVALSEHVYLAAAATGAALGGRDAEFQAAA